MRISDWSSDVCSSDLTHREFAGRLLGNVGRQDHLVRRTATALLDVHLVKEIQAAQPRPGAAQLGGIEGVTLGQPELAADHLVQRAPIAADVDALDQYPRALADRILAVVTALLQFFLSPI